LIGAEGAKTPAGVRDRGDPAGAERVEEAPRTARGKRSTWSGNQHTHSRDNFNVIGFSISNKNKKLPRSIPFLDNLGMQKLHAVFLQKRSITVLSGNASKLY
jgi:hypothetical protein